MANKIQKTNAARLLDKLKIQYELVPYEFDPDDLAAEHVAEELEEPIEQVYKTLVLRGVAGNREVDLKLAAKASGNKKAEMLPLKELLPNTGYIRGGCTSIGMKKHYPTYFSEEMADFDVVYVSAGQRGLQLKLSPLDLAKAAQATFVKITDNPES